MSSHMVDRLSIRTIMDNTAGLPGIRAEHVSSILLETPEAAVLFDYGPSSLVCHNARRLGIDLSGLSAIVLSHGHSDHTGGLAAILRKVTRHPIPVHSHPSAMEQKYNERDGRFHPIGMRISRQRLMELGGDLRVSNGPVEVAPGVWTSGEIPRGHGPEALSPRFRVRKNGRIEADHVLDDQFLWARTPEGLVAVFGCCHAGLENSLHHLRDISGDGRIRLIVGGLHLLNRPPAEARVLAGRIAGVSPGAIVVGHCTGFEASAALVAALPGKVFRNEVGTRIDVGVEVKVS
ncbi:MAG: MBL fold metallo-hydrolase [Bacillota bacterium]